MVAIRTIALGLLGTLLAAHSNAACGADSQQVQIPGGVFESVLPPAPRIKAVKLGAFRLDRTPVSNAQFARFVRQQPQWRRDRIARVFADRQYLDHWQSADEPGSAILRQPVVHVSWFAASAYCESRGARLPTWHEWEYVAAAGAVRADERDDAQWQQQILGWYARPASSQSLPNVGGTAANFYGVQDLHGVVWEWVEDVNALLVSDDNREQSAADTLRFCGPGALTMEQKENYATLMRIAMLSSMQASFTGAAMGFRCAGDGAETPR